jgi:hypothetical protein
MTPVQERIEAAAFECYCGGFRHLGGLYAEDPVQDWHHDRESVREYCRRWACVRLFAYTRVSAEP